MLSGAALLGVGAGLDHIIAKSPHEKTVKPQPGQEASASAVPFYGTHQAGIATAAQDYLSFAAFDLTSNAVEDLRGILQEWTTAAASLTAGEPYHPAVQESGQPPADPGEAIGLPPAQITITIGFGPTLFGTPGNDRFGLAHAKPRMLKPLPPFQGENLDVNSSGGDLCVQACANDPQVAFHALHVFSRIASSAASLRWSQLGFGRTSSTSHTQATPRNLMGFKDGTDNIRGEEAGAMNDYVWVQPNDGPAWMTGGTYLIARRIKILFDVWDSAPLEAQQRAIGRDKLTGAPLGSTSEYDPVNLAASSNGELLIPTDAHIRLANPQVNGGEHILRRGYSYSEPSEPGSGQIDAGLFFIAFQRSPERQFIPLQRRLAASDALNQHTIHTSSAMFACPPGASPGGFIGDMLFS